MRRIIVKEGPIVFLRNVIVMEIAATILFVAASFLENYEMLYQSLGFESLVRYDIFLVVLFSLFQLIYIEILFFGWYFSHFEIDEREIVWKSGLLFRRRKSVSIGDVVSVEVYQSPLGRMINHATIILEHGRAGAPTRVTKIKNVSGYEEYVHIIKSMIQQSSGRTLTKDIQSLLDAGEGLFVEFKETLRYDVRKGEISKDLERVAMKSIVGFMNADGGTLIIGVRDTGGGVSGKEADLEVVGLERDYKTLPKKNRDGFENHVSMLVKNMIGMPFIKYVSVKFEKADGKDGLKQDVCLITVRESHKPAYLRGPENKEEFFVRVGNSTQPFSMSEAEEYIKTHWK